jgi:hypothetical protein
MPGGNEALVDTSHGARSTIFLRRSLLKFAGSPLENENENESEFIWAVRYSAALCQLSPLHECAGPSQDRSRIRQM